MKNIIIFLLSLTLTNSYSQGNKTKKLIAEIESELKTNSLGELEYVKIFNNIKLSKEELLDNCKAYFKSSNSHTKYDVSFEKEKHTAIFKLKSFAHKAGIGDASDFVYGIYDGRISFKENKIRIILTLKEWLVIFPLNNLEERYFVKEEYPFNKDILKDSKNLFGKSLYKSHKNIDTILKELSKGIINYKTHSTLDEDW